MTLSEASRYQQIFEVLQHIGAATDHRAIVVDGKWFEADIVEQLSGGYEICYSAAIVEGFSRYGRIVRQLLAEEFANKLVAW